MVSFLLINCKCDSRFRNSVIYNQGPENKPFTKLSKNSSKIKFLEAYVIKDTKRQ